MYEIMTRVGLDAVGPDGRMQYDAMLREIDRKSVV